MILFFSVKVTLSHSNTLQSRDNQKLMALHVTTWCALESTLQLHIHTQLDFKGRKPLLRAFKFNGNQKKFCPLAS